MGRAHSKSRRHSDAKISLVATIILLTLIYVHRNGIVQLLLITILCVSAYFITIKSTTLYKRYRVIHKHGIGLSSVDKMSGIEFELFVASLLRKQGYTNVKLTEKYDYGVDIIASKDGIQWGIQVKRYSGLVKADAVRQVVTALRKYNCSRAMVITNSSYSKVAIELARTNHCLLIDRGTLLN